MAADLDADAALMLKVREGDLQAFESLVEKHKQGVYNVVCRNVGDPVEAEDLTQNVFIQVFKSAGRYKVQARFTTWLYTIARNLCLNEIRRRLRHRTESLESGHEEEDYPVVRQHADAAALLPSDLVLRGELEAQVERAILGLPEKQRLALLMCREEALSYEDMAKVLKCSLSATKSLIHRARETLKQQLKPYLDDGTYRE